MASTPTFSVSKPNFPLILSSSRSTVLSPLQFPFPYLEFHNHFHNNSISSISSPVKQRNKHRHLRPTKVSAATEEEETLVPEEETSPAPAGDSSDQTVSVPVSPSDVLTMIFQADGTLSDAAIPAVTKALEEVEGVSDLKVQVLEGIASVELTKQTTVQATGVASNLVEIIQGSGFKLQTLNLSFQDEEDFS